MNAAMPMPEHQMHEALHMAAAAPPVLADAIGLARGAGVGIWQILAILYANKDSIVAAIAALMDLVNKLKPTPPAPANP